MRLCLHFDQLMTLHDDTARKNMQGQHIKSRRSIRNFETHLTSNKRVAFQSNYVLLRFPTFFKQQWKKHNDIVQQMTSEASFKQRQQLRAAGRQNCICSLIFFLRIIICITHCFVFPSKSRTVRRFRKLEFPALFQFCEVLSERAGNSNVSNSDAQIFCAFISNETFLSHLHPSWNLVHFFATSNAKSYYKKLCFMFQIK